uniref:Retrovirus-related Pol polyprotein from transposon TNT 1-94-like beta-barrel domain-containing protein n=1 Tax=Lactuca sativa TaxID=4236 RepID=A0A9R1XTF5_LACSA|nr:hypothetical protein LSAT_V11C200080010 [Lactuca sativa]
MYGNSLSFVLMVLPVRRGIARDDRIAHTLISALLTQMHFWNMKDFFFTNNLASFIDETINQPNEGSPNLNAWKHSDSIINDWLTKSMKKEIQNSFKIINLFSSYFTKLRSIWDEIKSTFPTPRCMRGKCMCNLGKRLVEEKEKECIYEFLMGLDDVFCIVKTQILSTKPMPSLGTCYHLVPKMSNNEILPQQEKQTWKQSPPFRCAPIVANVEQEGIPIPGNFNFEPIWIIDSGATNHVAYRESVFTNFKKPENGIHVSIPNGDNFLIKGIGSVQLPNDVKIDDVMTYTRGSLLA